MHGIKAFGFKHFVIVCIIFNAVFFRKAFPYFIEPLRIFMRRNGKRSGKIIEIIFFCNFNQLCTVICYKFFIGSTYTLSCLQRLLYDAEIVVERLRA